MLRHNNFSEEDTSIIFEKYGEDFLKMSQKTIGKVLSRENRSVLLYVLSNPILTLPCLIVITGVMAMFKYMTNVPWFMALPIAVVSCYPYIRFIQEQYHVYVEVEETADNELVILLHVWVSGKSTKTKRIRISFQARLV